MEDSAVLFADLFASRHMTPALKCWATTIRPASRDCARAFAKLAYRSRTSMFLHVRFVAAKPIFEEITHELKNCGWLDEGATRVVD